jgi:N-acetyl sugar amidotransferase
MDTTDPWISFDGLGRCNHCHKVDAHLDQWDPRGNEPALARAVDRIKRDGRGREYDVVMGLSGGVDSSYLAYQASRLGLRALIIHVDTGWNSELAVKNVETIVSKLGFDLHTLVVDWEEMQDLQLAFFRSGVPNQDVPQDHAIAAGFLRCAAKYNVRWAFNGSNLACESILPKAWGYDNMDLTHIRAIHRRFGKRPLRKFPTVSYVENAFRYQLFHRLNVITPLNLLPYDKLEAMRTLERELGWQYYGGKHYESRFTKFFQSWYLPTRWGYDKRLAHLSSLVASRQITRDEALREFRDGVLPVGEIDSDKSYMARKLGLSRDEFDQLMLLPCVPHESYPVTSPLIKKGKVVYAILRGLTLPAEASQQPTGRRRIVHVHDSPLTHASRDLREAFSAVRSGIADEVVILGRARDGLPDVERPADQIRLVRLRLHTTKLPAIKLFAPLKMWETRWRYARSVVRLNPDIIQCHGVATLGASVSARRRLPNARLIYDPHELETESNGLRQPLKSFRKWSERRLIASCDGVLSVCDSIADWYRDAYRIERPTVVRNIARSQGSRRDGRPLRRRLGIPDSELLFIYQGGLFRGRRVEQLIRVFQQVPRDRHLVFMGYGDLESLVKTAAECCPNIHFHPAVAPDDVLEHTRDADVGLTGVENVCLSYYYSLPNKLFEYMVAGVPFIVPPYPEMTRLVEQYQCGWIAGEDDDSWARLIASLTADNVADAKAHSMLAASSCSWANEERALIETYIKVQGRRSRTQMAPADERVEYAGTSVNS